MILVLFSMMVMLLIVVVVRTMIQHRVVTTQLRVTIQLHQVVLVVLWVVLKKTFVHVPQVAHIKLRREAALNQ